MIKRTIVPAMVLLACLLPALPAMSLDGSGVRMDGASCGIIEPASGPLLVTEERPKVIPFSFRVGGFVTEVRFLISKRDKAKGIALLEETVKVKDGVATSRLSFKIFNGMPLGRHDLVIEVLDAGRGAKICSGTIPYIILPGAACMCRETRGQNRLSEWVFHTAKNTGRYKNA